MRSYLGAYAYGDGYENVSYKVNSRSFNLYRAYSVSFNTLNAVIFLVVEF